jgi:hypothetical protein
VRVAIVTNTDNGKGLQRDAHILSERFALRGHAVTLVHFQKAPAPPRHAYDLAVFLEVGGKREARFHGMGRRQWLIPNPEWWEPGDSLDPFDRVLCKTSDAERIFRARVPDHGRRVGFLGFTSQDVGIATDGAPQRRAVLHIAGGSTMKGTQAVLDAWAQWNGAEPPPPLFVCTSMPDAFRWPKNPLVSNLGRRPPGELAALQRSLAWHVQPSEYEGFGHVLHEGRSAGAVVLTTAAPPMNEAAGLCPWVATHASFPLKSARTWRVSAGAVGAAVHRATGMSDVEIKRRGAEARDAWQADRDAFFAALDLEMEAV